MFRRAIIAATAVALTLMGAGPAAAVDVVPAGALFIAPGGSDSNPCTQAAPCATFQKALTSGKTFVARGGTYSRAENFKPVAGSRLLEYPGETAVHKGKFWLQAADRWEIEGVGFTWGPGLTASDHMVKLTGGVSWRFHDTEVWGSQSWANVLIVGAPNLWRFDHNVVHDAIGSPTHNGVQDHNVYINTVTSTTATGLFDHNLLYNAARGEDVKADGTGGTSGGAMGVRFEFNTFRDARRYVLTGGTSNRNEWHHNEFIGDGDSSPWDDALMRVYLPQAGFAHNTWHDNIVRHCPGKYVGSSSGMVRSADVCG